MNREKCTPDLLKQLESISDKTLKEQNESYTNGIKNGKLLSFLCTPVKTIHEWSKDSINYVDPLGGHLQVKKDEEIHIVEVPLTETGSCYIFQHGECDGMQITSEFHCALKQTNYVIQLLHSTGVVHYDVFGKCNIRSSRGEMENGMAAARLAGEFAKVARMLADGKKTCVVHGSQLWFNVKEGRARFGTLEFKIFFSFI